MQQNFEVLKKPLTGSGKVPRRERNAGRFTGVPEKTKFNK